MQEVNGSNLCAGWCSDSAIAYSMPRTNTAQAGTCHALAAALHGLTYTCCQLAVAVILLPALKLPRAAFCSLSSAAFWLPSVACLELPF